eukprot:6185888-Pleurochrysis_carterae.AAC.2
MVAQEARALKFETLCCGQWRPSHPCGHIHAPGKARTRAQAHTRTRAHAPRTHAHHARTRTRTHTQTLSLEASRDTIEIC